MSASAVANLQNVWCFGARHTDRYFVGGNPFEKGCPPDPFPKPLNEFKPYGTCAHRA